MLSAHVVTNLVSSSAESELVGYPCSERGRIRHNHLVRLDADEARNMHDQKHKPFGCTAIKNDSRSGWGIWRAVKNCTLASVAAKTIAYCGVDEMDEKVEILAYVSVILSRSVCFDAPIKLLNSVINVIKQDEIIQNG